jgi:hypothetical protein
MLKIKEIVVFYLGENIWKWRLQSHIDRVFAEFDVFMDKTIQYLASSSSKSIGCLSRKFLTPIAVHDKKSQPLVTYINP